MDEERGAKPAFIEHSGPREMPPSGPEPPKVPAAEIHPPGDRDPELDESMSALASGVMDVVGGRSPEAKAVFDAFHSNLARAKPRLPNLAAGKAPPPMPRRPKKAGRPDPRSALIAAARGEPTLALKLLQSLRQGPTRMARRSLDLEEIGRRLPIPMLRDLVAGSGGPAPAKSPWDTLLDNLWRHTLVAARTAEIVARDQLRREPGAIYTITLLHNIGEIAIVDLFRGLGETPPGDGVARDKLAEEMERFHETIGGVILRRWKLPSILSAVASKHHDPLAHPPGTPPARYAALVSGSSAAASLAGVVYREGRDRPEDDLESSADMLGVEPDSLVEAAKTALGEWSHQEPADPANS